MTIAAPTAASQAAAGPPVGRYILPQFEERTAYGFKRLDPYTKLFEDRIIFLGVQVDDASADDVMAQLLVLESQDPDRDIIMYINSPGRLVHRADGDLRHDAVHQAATSRPSASARPRRRPRCCSAAGRQGKRLALPNARVLIHQPAMEGGDYGQASDIEIQANEVLRMRDLARGDARPPHRAGRRSRSRKDIERDKILTAPQARGVRPRRPGARQPQGPRRRPRPRRPAARAGHAGDGHARSDCR